MAWHWLSVGKTTDIGAVKGNVFELLLEKVSEFLEIGVNVGSSMKELLKAGLLQVGEEFQWQSRVQQETHQASVTPNGDLRTSDGKIHKTPSGALKHLNGNKPVDGWLAWKSAKTDESLSKIRQKLII